MNIELIRLAMALADTGHTVTLHPDGTGGPVLVAVKPAPADPAGGEVVDRA